MEKRGLTAALVANDITPDDLVGFGDELRITLHGALSRLIVPKGTPMRQLCQGERVGVTLALCVDGECGTLSWEWLGSMHHQEILRALARWNADGFDAVVWDNASSHKEERVQAWGMPLVQQPAYSPELNPAERLNEEIRRFLKGKTFATLAEKVWAVENHLRWWKAHPAGIQQLCGYGWIVESITRRDKIYAEREEQPVDGREKLVA